MSKEVTITRTFNAPRELVFKAWTDADQLAQWWGPDGFSVPLCEADARPGGDLLIHMQAPDGTIYPMTGTFKDVIAPGRLSFVSKAFDAANKYLFDVLTTVTFTAIGDKTEVKMHALVAEVTPETKPYLDGMDAGWTQSLDKLDTFTAEPFVIERTFNASVEKVWSAITNRDEMSKWYFDLAEFRPVVGFEFEFIGSTECNEYRHLCKVTEVEAGRKITYSWRYDGYAGNSFVTFELFPVGGKTTLKLTHTGLATFPASNPDFAKHNFAAGWADFIGRSLPQYLHKA